MSTKHVVAENCEVSLNFSLSLESGQEVDSTFGKEPARLQIGDGNLPENFEKLIVGLAEGERQSFKVEANDAFGEPNPKNVQRLPRTQFKGIELEKGTVVNFASGGEGELPGVIKAVGEIMVEVDFNHPLAGQALNFEVEIISVKAL